MIKTILNTIIYGSGIALWTFVFWMVLFGGKIEWELKNPFHPSYWR